MTGFDFSNAHYEELYAIRDRYQNKRTLGYALVDSCLKLVDSAMLEERARWSGKLEQALEEVGRERKTLDRVREDNKRLRASLEEKTVLREARTRDGDEEVRVTIDRSLGGWCVSDLEEVAYRLRSGGAEDETPVKITDYSITANVPAPNLIPLTRPSKTPEPLHVQPPVYDEPTNMVPVSRTTLLMLMVASVFFVLGGIGLFIALAG